MFKIDIHTHIIPPNINDVTKFLSDERFLIYKKINNKEADLYKNNIFFRRIRCNCWDEKIRINEMKESKINIQVLSTIPVLFSYWSKVEDCTLLSRFINDHISEVIKLYPKKYFGLGSNATDNNIN